MIGVKRDTGMVGILDQITIYIDGQQAEKVKQNQQIQLEIPRKEASIYVSQGGSHSNELIVKDGQVFEITNSF